MGMSFIRINITINNFLVFEILPKILIVRIKNFSPRNNRQSEHMAII